MNPSVNHKLVKSEDLNHHRTLYAGRCAEWVVEAGFIAAAKVLGADHVVCFEIHGMRFTKPVRAGQIVMLHSRPVLAGRTRLVVHVEANLSASEEAFVESFLTFVHVDAEGHPSPHGFELRLTTEAEQRLADRAKALPRK